jgi:hypothetical protein
MTADGEGANVILQIRMRRLQKTEGLFNLLPLRTGYINGADIRASVQLNTAVLHDCHAKTGASEGADQLL